MEEGVIEEKTAAFCPALGLPTHHELTATRSFQALGTEAEKTA